MHYKLLMLTTEQPSGQEKTENYPYAATEVYTDAFFHVSEDQTVFSSSEADLMLVVQSYAETPAGRLIVQENNRRMTWGHVLEQVPTSIFEKHGFFRMDQIHRFNTPPFAVEHLNLKRGQVLISLPFS